MNNNSIYTELYPELIAAISRDLLFRWQESARHFLGRSAFELIEKPTIQIVDNASFLGRFSYNGKPTIELSAKLIKEHSWGAVVNVFLHEVAHQLTAFVHAGKELQPHGKEFRQVCAAIGATPDASADEKSLDETMQKPTAQGDAIIDKLRKLLTLADKGDVHEAEVALAKALELMAKYGLTEADTSEENQYVTVTFGPTMKRTSSFAMRIGNLLESYWNVYVVRTYMPSPDNAEAYVSIYTMSGTKNNVAIAQYVYDYIINNMNVAFSKVKKNLTGRMIKRDFCLGFLSGIEKKLKGAAANPEVQALIHKGDAATAEYVRHRYPHLHTTHGRCLSRGSDDALQAGRMAGSSLVINPGIGIEQSNHYLTE